MRTSHSSRPATASTYLERVNLAIDHILTNLDKPLRLDDVARAAHFSPFHFHRVFQAITGETLADFTKRLRLERALSMMANPPRNRAPSLTHIALACGFSSSSDFSRAFKDRFGAPPSSFDISAHRAANRQRLESLTPRFTSLPSPDNPDNFSVTLRDLPPRTVAYIRVDNPYLSDAVHDATTRLLDWAQAHNHADNQWLGYQYENPELVPLEHCRYYVAVEAEHFTPEGEIGRFRFPHMTVAELPILGDIALEIRALTWLYGSWLPRSGLVPDNLPGFEAWNGRPFSLGLERFDLRLWLPVRQP